LVFKKCALSYGHVIDSEVSEGHVGSTN